MPHQWSVLSTPIGPLYLAVDADALCEIHFETTMPRDWRAAARPPRDAMAKMAAEQLIEYFRGTRRQFDLPLAPHGTTFQQRVWDALKEIPYGETASYGEIARAIGMPGAARAVGAANGRNPIPIVIPCHRVIGSQGRLTGYGGGLKIKRQLLDLERRNQQTPRRPTKQATFSVAPAEESAQAQFSQKLLAGGNKK